MKIKVEIDLEDVLSDIMSEYHYEDGSSQTLSDEIVGDIKRSVKKTVLDSLKGQIDTEIVDQVKAKLVLDLNSHIQGEISKVTPDIKFKWDRYDEEERTISEHLKHIFEKADRSSNQCVQKHISEQSEAMIKQLKDGYDLYFASQIVSKLSDKGMLSEDIAKSLVEMTPKEK